MAVVRAGVEEALFGCQLLSGGDSFGGGFRLGFRGTGINNS